MKVTVENKKGLNKDLKIFIDKETMNSYMDEKYEEIKGSVNLKGFRPGKVPKEILKRQFGQAIYSEVLDKVLKETTTKALEENKIKPAGKRDIQSMVNLCIKNLDQIDFFKPKEKRPIMLENLRNIFYKMDLSDKETRILSSVFSSLGKKR